MRISLAALKRNEVVDIGRYALTVFVKRGVTDGVLHIFVEDIIDD